MRPLQRGGVLAPREAAFREEAANMRWYRDFDRPLSNTAEGVFYCSLRYIE